MPGHDAPGTGTPGTLANAHAARADIAAAALDPDLPAGLKSAARTLRTHFRASHAAVLLSPRRLRQASAVDSSFADAEWVDRWLADPDPAHRHRIEDESVALVADLADTGRGEARDALLSQGMRASMALPMRDENDDVMGYVALAAAEPGTFGLASLDEFREIVATLASSVRRAILVDQLEAERALLRQEARILGLVSGARSEGELARAAIEGIREALAADAAAIVAIPGDGTSPILAAAPEGIPIDALERVVLVRAAVSNGRGMGDEGHYNPDLAHRAETPAEIALFDTFGYRSVLAAYREATNGQGFFVGASSLLPYAWDDSERAFLVRLAAVLDLSLRRLREEQRAREQGDRAEAQARLLTVLDPTRPLSEIAATFADSITGRFQIDSCAIVRLDPEKVTPTFLYVSPDVAPAPADTIAGFRRSDYVHTQEGRVQRIDLRHERRIATENYLFEQGITHIVRVPIGAEGSVFGFVTAGWRGEEAPPFDTNELVDAIRPLGVVFERAALLGGLERRTRVLATSAEMLASVSGAAGLAEATEEVARAMRSHFQAAHAGAGVVDLDSPRVESFAVDSAALTSGDFHRVLTERDVQAYRAIVENGPEFWDDLKQVDLNPGTALLRKVGLRSAIRAGFALADGLAGLITVARLEPGQFSEGDARELAELCRTAGLAIDRVRLISKLQETAALLEAQTRVLAALAPGATVEDVASVVVAEARRLFDASHAVVIAFAEGQSQVVAISSENMTSADLTGRTQGEDGNPDALEALQAGRTHIVGDLEETRTGRSEEAAHASGLRCLMRAPILGPGNPLRGLISVGSTSPHAYGEADVARLGELATVVSVVAERAQLLEEAAERSEKVSRLTHLLGTLSATASPEDAARLFAAQLRPLLHADAVLINAFDRNSGLRRRIAYDGDAQLDALDVTTALPRSDSFEEMHHSALLRYDANEPFAAPAWMRESARARGAASAAVVRLSGADGPVGLIAAGSRRPGAFDDSAIQLLTELAMPLAMVLERAHIVTSLQRQTDRAQAVMEILAALGPRESLEAAAVPLARALRTMYGADHCIVGTIENGVVRLAAHDSDLDLSWLPETYRFEQLTTAQAAAVTGYHVIADIQDAPHVQGPMAEGLRQSGLRSTMRVLLGDPGEPVGVLTVGSLFPGRYTDADAIELRQITQPLAVAAGYFRSLREAERRNRQLEYTNRILSRLSSGGKPGEITAAFLAECRSLFGCPHAVAVRFDLEAGLASLMGMDSSAITNEDVTDPAPLDALRSSRLLADTAPDIVADARDAADPGMFHPLLIERGLYSALRVPIMHDGAVTGAIALWGEGAGCFDAEDARLLAALVHPFALAIERAEALAALAESETKYRSLVSQAEEMIFLFDAGTRRILDANAYTARSLGYAPEELLQLRLDDLCIVPEDFISANVQHILETGEVRLSEHEYRRKDGSLVMVDIVASRAAFGGRQAVMVLARDITEVRGFQRQLMQTQKMESLGTMAGAVAHDFNNLLTTILGFAGLLKRSPHLDDEDRENLGLIEDASRHAADLTGRLLAFARGGLVRFGPVDLRDAVRDTLRLAEPALHSNLRVTMDLPDEPVMVEGDQGQLQQALINIVLNARDAMPEGGSITVELHAAQAVAMLTLADDGPGMSEETRTRIFEPFYTTKPPGSGTGLGMAITYGIVQGHHGTVVVDSAPGKGTTFVITLPLLPSDASHHDDAYFNTGDGDLILIVDDDERVRRATHATLAELGYNVVEARDGATAIQLLKARPERFAAVLLDLVMPGMTGSETFRGLEAIRPDLPVIVCTAYAADAHIDTDVKRRIAGLIQKPFNAERLERALAAVGAKR